MTVDRDDGDGIFYYDSDSGSSIYSSGNESCSGESFSRGETCSSGDTSSSDDELPNNEGEQFINDVYDDDDDEVSGEDSGSDASQTSRSYKPFLQEWHEFQ